MPEKRELVIIYNSDGITGFYCKGHIDRERFLARIQNETGFHNAELDEIELGYFRLTPSASEDYDFFIGKSQVQERGMFAATYIWREL